jgi:hypothetical protein
MTQEYTFVVNGTPCTITVTSGSVWNARNDAALRLNVPVYQVSWLRAPAPLGDTQAQFDSWHEDMSKLNGFYSGIEM